MKNAMTNEILSMNELDSVNGGNNGEYKEIARLLPEVDLHFGDSGQFESDMMSPEEVTGWLKKNLNIDAKIDNGAFFNPLSSAGKRNVYMRDGKSLTHSKVIAEIHNYFGK